MKCWVKIRIHCQTLKAVPLRFGNVKVISSPCWDYNKSMLHVVKRAPMNNVRALAHPAGYVRASCTHCYGKWDAEKVEMTYFTVWDATNVDADIWYVKSQSKHVELEPGCANRWILLNMIQWVTWINQKLQYSNYKSTKLTTTTPCTCLGYRVSWWRHQMETFPALLAICAGNSPVTGEFSAQRPVTQSFDVFFDLRPNKELNKQ